MRTLKKKISIHITSLLSWRFYQSTFLAARMNAHLIESSPTINIIIFQNLYYYDLWNLTPWSKFCFSDYWRVEYFYEFIGFSISSSWIIYSHSFIVEWDIAVFQINCASSLPWLPCNGLQPYPHHHFFMLFLHLLLPLPWKSSFYNLGILETPSLFPTQSCLLGESLPTSCWGN